MIKLLFLLLPVLVFAQFKGYPAHKHFQTYEKSITSISEFVELFSSAQAIYSVRQINPDEPYCVKVRRSSDDATLDIGYVNEALDESALLVFASTDSALVEVWYDQSGNNNDLSQANDGKQLLIALSGNVIKNNGKPALLTVSGKSTHLYGTFGTAAPFYFFGVYNTLTLPNNFASVYGQGNQRIAFMVYPSSSIVPNTSFWINAPNISSTYGLLNSLNYLQNLHAYYIPDATESNWKWYHNGTEKGAPGLTAGTATVTAGATTYIGYSGYSTQYWKGYIQEIIIYDSDQTAKRGLIEANINGYYEVW